MGKSLIRFVAVLLAAALCFGCVTFAAGSDTKETLRVGLFYGSTALPGANLENSVGSGYRFGWYDDNLTFHQLGSSPETQISVVKTQNAGGLFPPPAPHNLSQLRGGPGGRVDGVQWVSRLDRGDILCEGGRLHHQGGSPLGPDCTWPVHRHGGRHQRLCCHGGGHQDRKAYLSV